jgi:hypothetical protein
MHNYISCIRTKLQDVFGNRNADLIRSYRRALNSGIACAQEAATREAEARGWDPVAFDGRPHCCRRPCRCCRSSRKRPEPAGKREQSSTPPR